MGVTWKQHSGAFVYAEIAQQIPTVPTPIFAADCYIVELEIVNDTGNTAHISLYDYSPTPLCLLTPRNPLPAGGIITGGDMKIPMSGGVNLSCDIPGVSIFMRLQGCN